MCARTKLRKVFALTMASGLAIGAVPEATRACAKNNDDIRTFSSSLTRQGAGRFGQR